jgi:uncharacterized GH25 family protein
MKIRPVFALALLLVLGAAASGHDTWVQSNTPIVRAGDAAYVDLFLGNHGNEHRDFKVAGKPDLAKSTFTVTTPEGKTIDLCPTAIDQGYAPKEGYFTARITTARPGIYLIAQHSDSVVSYAPERSIHSAKTFVLASTSLDKVPNDAPGFDRVLGDPLEIVPQSTTIAPMGPGVPIRVRVLFKGKPLADARISFIPRGTTLAEGFDSTYERHTDSKGLASFEPKEANLYLVAVHHETDEKGKGYDSTKYGATLTVLVPAICPCCGE